MPVQRIHHPPIALKLLACKNPRFFSGRFVCDIERGAADAAVEREGEGAEAKVVVKGWCWLGCGGMGGGAGWWGEVVAERNRGSRLTEVVLVRLVRLEDGDVFD